MPEKPFRYYGLQLLGLLLCFLGFIAIKLIPAFVCVGIIVWLDIELESLAGVLVATIGFLIIMSLFSFPVGKHIVGFGTDLLDTSRKYKKSYLSDYGADLEEPTFDEFNLKPEDYYSYNRRWRLSDVAVIFIAGSAVGSAFLLKSLIGVENVLNGFLIFSVSIIIAICTYYVVKSIDNLLDCRLPQHNQVQEYKAAKKIYDSVKNELREKRFRSF